MSKKDDKFEVAGIVTVNGGSKIRFTNDLIRRYKMFNKEEATRVDLVNLPTPMTKLEALAYIKNLEQFSDPIDQVVIEEAIEYRQLVRDKEAGIIPKRPRGRPRKNPTIVIQGIRSKESITAIDILSAIGMGV